MICDPAAALEGLKLMNCGFGAARLGSTAKISPDPPPLKPPLLLNPRSLPSPACISAAGELVLSEKGICCKTLPPRVKLTIESPKVPQKLPSDGSVMNRTARPPPKG